MGPPDHVLGLGKMKKKPSQWSNTIKNGTAKPLLKNREMKITN